MGDQQIEKGESILLEAKEMNKNHKNTLILLEKIAEGKKRTIEKRLGSQID